MSEKADKKTLEVTGQSLSAYEEGALYKITADDMVGNLVSIMQLMNEYNVRSLELAERDEQLKELTNDFQYLKTTPFIAISSLISNTLGLFVSGIGINLTQSPDTNTTGWTLGILGFLLVISGSLLSILYPSAKNWFNKEKKNAN